MKQEKQNVAIAIVCGWRLPNKGERCGDFDTGDGIFTPEGWPWWIKQIPNYVADLNEIHEAEKRLPVTSRDSWNVNLAMVVGRKHRMASIGGWLVPTATAEERSEAFLRTLNLWKE